MRDMDFLYDKSEKGLYYGICIAILLVAAFYFIYLPCQKASFEREWDIHVVTTTTKNTGKSGKYIVIGDDREGTRHSFEVTDCLLKGRFDSTDVWGSIEEGGYYHFVTGGNRIPIVSCYPNIYEVTEIEPFDTEK